MQQQARMMMLQPSRSARLELIHTSNRIRMWFSWNQLDVAEKTSNP
jgi:hypothetical protein